MITMEDIVREGHPALRKKTKNVPIPPTKEDINTLDKMLTFLKNSQDEQIAEEYNLRGGVGLAAPQLGINKQLVAIYLKDSNDKLYNYKLFNPKVISHSIEMAYLENGEGCLSVDRPVEGYVPRYARITIEAFNEKGEKITLRLRNYPAIVFQHEIDHLNGIMFFDHINKEQPFQVPKNARAIG